MEPQIKVYDAHRWLLWQDQYGALYPATSIANLKEQIGAAPRARVTPMFVDKIAGPHAGKAMQVGVIIRVGRNDERWLTAYARLEIEPKE